MVWFEAHACPRRDGPFPGKMWGTYHYAAAAAAKLPQSCLTVRPHRRQPIRLPCPWDSPGKNTGVRCCFLLQCMKVKSESDLVDCSPPGSSIHGIFQARTQEWVAIAFSRGSSWPRNRTQVSCIVGRFFTDWAMRDGCLSPFPLPCPVHLFHLAVSQLYPLIINQ